MNPGTLFNVLFGLALALLLVVTMGYAAAWPLLTFSIGLLVGAKQQQHYK